MSRENADEVCGTCRFYEEEYNECRRRAITDRGFPNTELAAWCGEFVLSKEPLKEEHSGWRSPLNKCEVPI